MSSYGQFWQGLRWLCIICILSDADSIAYNPKSNNLSGTWDLHGCGSLKRCRTQMTRRAPTNTPSISIANGRRGGGDRSIEERGFADGVLDDHHHLRRGGRRRFRLGPSLLQPRSLHQSVRRQLLFFLLYSRGLIGVWHRILQDSRSISLSMCLCDANLMLDLGSFTIPDCVN